MVDDQSQLERARTGRSGSLLLLLGKPATDTFPQVGKRRAFIRRALVIGLRCRCWL